MTLVCMALSGRSLHAQTDTIFIDQQGIRVNREHSVFRRLVSAEANGRYAFRDYDSNMILRKVFYSASAQGSLIEGEYLEYDTKGHVSVKGAYQKGFKSGEWLLFFASGESVMEKQTYTDQHAYYLQQFDSLTRSVSNEGMIDKSGKRNGIWKQYFRGDTMVKNVSQYRNGRREGEQTEYHRNGKIKRKEYFQNNTLSKGEMYDSLGQRIRYFPAFVYPRYPDYIGNYLQKKVPCYTDSLSKKEFRVSISINREGRVTGVEVSLVPDGECVAEIRKALLQMKQWKPALWEGKPINYTLETRVRQYTPAD